MVCSSKMKNDIQLQEGVIRLRAPEPEDLEVMYRFENSEEIWEVSNTTGPYSRFQLRQYIENSRNDLFADRQLRLMIEREGRVVGMIDICCFDPLHNRAEIGIMIDRGHRRRGIGRSALGLLEKHCFYYLGIHQLFAYIAVENFPCRNLFAACGYKEGAVLKDWMHSCGGGYTDVLVVQKINGQFSAGYCG